MSLRNWHLFYVRYFGEILESARLLVRVCAGNMPYFATAWRTFVRRSFIGKYPEEDDTGIMLVWF
jgi:hypothetical protein